MPHVCVPLLFKRVAKLSKGVVPNFFVVALLVVASGSALARPQQEGHVYRVPGSVVKRMVTRLHHQALAKAGEGFSDSGPNGLFTVVHDRHFGQESSLQPRVSVKALADASLDAVVSGNSFDLHWEFRTSADLRDRAQRRFGDRVSMFEPQHPTWVSDSVGTKTRALDWLIAHVDTLQPGMNRHLYGESVTLQKAKGGRGYVYTPANMNFTVGTYGYRRSRGGTDYRGIRVVNEIDSEGLVRSAARRLLTISEVHVEKSGEAPLFHGRLRFPDLAGGPQQRIAHYQLERVKDGLRVPYDTVDSAQQGN